MPVIDGTTTPAIESAAKRETAEHLKPSQADIRSIATSIDERPDGKFQAKIEGKKAIGAFMEAKRPWERKEAELSSKRDAISRKQRMYHRETGAEREIPEAVSDIVGRSGGWLPKKTWSSVPFKTADETYDPGRQLRTAAEIRWGDNE